MTYGVSLVPLCRVAGLSRMTRFAEASGELS